MGDFIFSLLISLFIFVWLPFQIFKKGFLKIKQTNMEGRVIDVNNFGPSLGSAKKWLVGIAIFIFLVIFLVNSVVIIQAGETGVYHLFGKVRDEELHAGFHFINPLASVTKMSIRTEEYTMSSTYGEGQRKGADSIKALTKEGLEVSLDITVWYHLEEEKASDVYKQLGVNYVTKIIRPSIRSGIREVIAKYEAKDIYSDKREEATQKILETLKREIEPRGIVIEDVLLRNVELPAKLSNAIQEKLTAEQEAKKYDFILQKEQKEAERKVIEAKGQRDSQKIINESLTPNYLYYLYIKELKDREGTIYVPVNPENGMPLFKNLK